MKKNIVFFCVIFFLILLFLTTPLFAVYEGDDTYTDPNNTIKIAYDTIISDMILRLSVSESDTTNILTDLKSSSYNFYAYYGQNDGSSMIGASTWKTDMLWIAFFSNSSPSVSPSSGTYQGIDCIINQSSPSKVYYFQR